MENSDSDVIGGDRGGIVTARGTGEGVTVRLDGRVDRHSLRNALVEFMHARKTFLSGNEVSLEWVAQEPEINFVEEIKALLFEDFSVRVRDSKLWDGLFLIAKEHEVGYAPPIENKRPMSLFDGMSSIGAGRMEKANKIGVSPTPVKPQGFERGQLAYDSSGMWDDADCRLVSATLRSGQRVETEHSIVIFGDVNSGAEIVAGGDIIVLGSLRGVAHAGAYDETGGGRIIFALNLQPTQLRIGTVISRGLGEEGGGSVPEVARIDGNVIAVEPYQPKNFLKRIRV